MKTNNKKQKTFEDRIRWIEKVCVLVLKHISDAGERNNKYISYKTADEENRIAEKKWCFNSVANGEMANDLLKEFDK